MNKENNNPPKTFKVELVGGPLCGLITEWPEHTPMLLFEKSNSRYEYEELSANGDKHTALYKGFID